MTKLIKILLPFFDVVLVPFTLLSSSLMLLIRKVGVQRMPVSRAVFRAIGVFPIRDHYYEPFFQPKLLKRPLSDERDLPGLDFNLPAQLELLSKFNYQDELLEFPLKPDGQLRYHYENSAFLYGDSEYFYSLIRHIKPKRIVEIGSGSSTLIAVAAIERNKKEDSGYDCELTCIEPFEHAWLSQLNIKLKRELVENMPASAFQDLEANDILFIDSSHMIRPQGDVLFEYLQLLPTLKPGVLVHVHDIFTPRDYPEKWIIKRNYFWNEQYLLEAFLSGNGGFEIVAMLNYLKHRHPEAMGEKFPIFKRKLSTVNPGSFWMRKI